MCKTTNITIHLIHPEEIDLIWGKVALLLEKCAREAPDVETASDYQGLLLSGYSALFVALDELEVVGVALIQRMTYANTRICRIRATAGERVPEWIEAMQEAVYNWAVLNDCQQIQAIDRICWKQFYKNDGWSMDKILYSKPVISNLH